MMIQLKDMMVFTNIVWLLGCDSLMFRTSFEDVEDAVYYEAATIVDVPASAEQLVILNYNIKYGGGRLLFFWECEGERYNMTTEEVTMHMDAVADFITAHNPDIVLLQEVDRNSLRCSFMCFSLVLRFIGCLLPGFLDTLVCLHPWFLCSKNLCLRGSLLP